MWYIKFSTSGASARSRLKTFPVGGWVAGCVGGEKLGLKLNSAKLGLEAWAQLGNSFSGYHGNGSSQLLFKLGLA